MKAHLLFLVPAVLLCGAAVETFGADIPFRKLDRGAYSGITEATNRVIKTEAEWEKLWKRHGALRVPPQPVPAVDFEMEMVVAVFMGQKPTGGHAIEIKRIETTPSRLRIFVERKEPGPDAIVTQALTAPFHFVAVSRSDLKPEFVVEE
jgi:hypothetical protein